ncbi:hypothetical protein NQ318_012249 [Aromia moschata]|uniref:Uncharacterized protein n=1 Tax=Aromia moschata TaxID=1265417 RepID=A0AAV8Y404_9CUCU|nr:hypothetical protein NQ318_012249 [Aromia moschata]
MCDPAFKSLVKKFDGLLEPRRYGFAERRKFFSSVKSERESVDMWASRVRQLAAKCHFGNDIDTYMRDRFVVGLPDGPVLDRLYEEDVRVLTFDRAIQIAKCVEAYLRTSNKAAGETKEDCHRAFRESVSRERVANIIPSTSFGPQPNPTKLLSTEDMKALCGTIIDGVKERVEGHMANAYENVKPRKRRAIIPTQRRITGNVSSLTSSPDSSPSPIAVALGQVNSSLVQPASSQQPALQIVGVPGGAPSSMVMGPDNKLWSQANSTTTSPHSLSPKVFQYDTVIPGGNVPSSSKVSPLIRDFVQAIDDREWQNSLYGLLQSQTYNQCEVDLFELMCKVLDQNLFSQVDWARNSIFFKDLKVCIISL